MNGCQSRSVLFQKKSNRKHGKWKWIHKPDIWPPCSIQKNRWDICKTFFSDFGCNFLLQEGVFHKCSKSKYHSIHQNKFFGTHFVCEKHPLHVFFFFPLFACIDLLKLFHLPIFGELRKLHAKNFMFSVKIGREIIFQSWQLFDLFFTQCYNFPIVHWLLYLCISGAILRSLRNNVSINFNINVYVKFSFQK